MLLHIVRAKETNGINPSLLDAALMLHQSNRHKFHLHHFLYPQQDKATEALLPCQGTVSRPRYAALI